MVDTVTLRTAVETVWSIFCVTYGGLCARGLLWRIRSLSVGRIHPHVLQWGHAPARYRRSFGLGSHTTVVPMVAAWSTIAGIATIGDHGSSEPGSARAQMRPSQVFEAHLTQHSTGQGTIAPPLGCSVTDTRAREGVDLCPLI